MRHLKFLAFLSDIVIELKPRGNLLPFPLVKIGVFWGKGMVKKLIRCSTCNQVIPNYEGYAVTQAQSLPGVEWSDADLVKAKEFLLTHSGHPLEELSVETDSLIGEKPAYEPIGVTYILASKGDRKYLIRRTRKDLGQPASYEIIPGKLKLSNVSLKIQQYDLRKQIDAEKGFSLLLKRKMEKFIQAFQEEMASISAEDFEGEAEAIEEGETSLIAFGSLKDSRWERILNRCGRFFKESELMSIRRFIDENRNPLDVLSIQSQRRISIISLVEGQAFQGIQEIDETRMAVESKPDEIAEEKTLAKRHSP
jgi:hypothetical protein